MTESEAWVRELLYELRADRYRSRAWLRFLVRSFERARRTRGERVHEHRETLRAGAIGLAAWAAVGPVRPWLALAGALWWLVVIAMIDWHLGMLEDADGGPQHRLGLANLLSLGRAAVVPALLVVSPTLLAAILIVAGLSDGIDGPLARRRGEETRLGEWLDGSVDTLVLSASALGLARHGMLSWWTAALVAARYAAPWLLVSLAYFVLAEPLERAGSASGKVAGLLLFSGLVLAAAHLPGAAPLAVLGALGGLVTVTLTVIRAQPVRA